MKTKKIKLLHRHFVDNCGKMVPPTKPYEVEQISDSNQYHPGDVLTEKEVGVLCADRRWNVTINKGH